MQNPISKHEDTWMYNAKYHWLLSLCTRNWMFDQIDCVGQLIHSIRNSSSNSIQRRKRVNWRKIKTATREKPWWLMLHRFQRKRGENCDAHLFVFNSFNFYSKLVHCDTCATSRVFFVYHWFYAQFRSLHMVNTHEKEIEYPRELVKKNCIPNDEIKAIGYDFKDPCYTPHPHHVILTMLWVCIPLGMCYCAKSLQPNFSLFIHPFPHGNSRRPMRATYKIPCYMYNRTPAWHDIYNREKKSKRIWG